MALLSAGLRARVRGLLRPLSLPVFGDATVNSALAYSYDAAKAQKVEGYLAWASGIQQVLPGGHPYVGAAPTTP